MCQGFSRDKCSYPISPTTASKELVVALVRATWAQGVTFSAARMAAAVLLL
jgi:hypothetical protein